MEYIAVCNQPHCCWNSRAIWDHTLLPDRGDIAAFTAVN